jgi:hypothetical protein
MGVGGRYMLANSCPRGATFVTYWQLVGQDSMYRIIAYGEKESLNSGASII